MIKSGTDTGVVIAQISEQLGGMQALSYVPPGYVGNCAVMSGSETLAVLSSGMEAVRIAAYAITPDGGYSDVSVHPSSLEPTHSSFCNWINGLQ